MYKKTGIKAGAYANFPSGEAFITPANTPIFLFVLVIVAFPGVANPGFLGVPLI